MHRPAPTRRLLAASAVAAALVGGAVVAPAVSTPAAAPAPQEAHVHGVDDAPHDDHGDDHGPDDGHGHEHDPALKNAISRAGVSATELEEPATAAEQRRSAAYVARSRRLPDPPLTTARLGRPRTTVPQDRFAMAGGCYALAGDPVRFQATDLGSYALWTADERFVSPTGPVTTPGDATDWVAREVRGGFTFRLGDGTWLTVDEQGDLAGGDAPRTFALRTTGGCAAYPEVQVNVRGLPHAGTTPFQEVRGYLDAHTHGMAYEFLGGEAHCGKPWDRFGAPYALVDCEDHIATGGNGAVLETALTGEPSHDPVGWPTFVDWPAPESLTHEGTYWKWMERAWRGGQRLFVNLLVENGQLCQVYPFKRNSCDEMQSVRLQATRMREFERYVDAQYGGPGRGWYRIVESPWEARRVINAGKLAVVMGIETSVPFGCTFRAVPLLGDRPACDEASIERQLDEVFDLGVRQMELVNKFDNALSGVAGDAGEIGVVINGANFNETGTFWDMRTCDPDQDPEDSDKTQLTAPDISAGQQDALFAAVGSLGLDLPAVPLYPQPQHCNARGLTDLGTFLLDEMVERGMLIDPDHMSVKARDMLLDHLEAQRYPGVLTSHSWSTPDAYQRVYRMGGTNTPYAGDSTGFVEKWRRHVAWADPRYFFGIGFGADINGLGAQGNPRGADVPNPVTYPFRGIGGVRIDQQVSGERVYDLNVDGVAHYGLYPDWVQDLRKVAGEDGDAIVEDMERGPEAYLQVWERAQGIAPDPCRNPRLQLREGAFRAAVDRGDSWREVLEAVGQPFTRLGRELAYCARGAGGGEVDLVVELTRGGRVLGVRRS